MFIFFFFFQAEDGIRDYKVTGVQTCALPISRGLRVLSKYDYAKLEANVAAAKRMDQRRMPRDRQDRKSTRLNSSHLVISYAVFCLKKKNKNIYILYL